MTVEDRVLLDLDDVLAFRIECGRCKTAVLIRPQDWKEVPFQCPGCTDTWELPAGESASPMKRLGVAFAQLQSQHKATDGKMPYRVRLEVKR